MHVSGPATGDVRVGFTGRLEAGRRLGRKDRSAQGRKAYGYLQARSPHGGARDDPGQREARSRARGQQHASPASPPCSVARIVRLDGLSNALGTLRA